MASLNVAIALWNHLNIPEIISNTNHYYILTSLESVLFDKLSTWANELPVPTSISEHIGKYLAKMQTEIKDWVSYHHQQVFFNNKSEKYIYYHVYNIVWYCNGTINYKKTAKSLLDSLRLSEVEKYYLLCTYCMKEEIERLSPSLFDNNVIDRVEFSSYPLIFYWNCYFRNELDKIITNPNESIDIYMIKRLRVDNWPAKEYFFDHLSSDEQILIAIWLIDNFGLKYLKLILMKLDESQRLRVYMDKSVKIITIYAQTGVNYEDVLTTWFEVRNLITSNQFVTIFKKILGVPNYIILNDVWISACDEFKRHLFSCPDQDEIVENALRLWISDRDNDFFFTMMQEASTNLKLNITKRRYFLQVCEKFISEDELKLLERLLNLCFSDTQELAQYKQYLTNEDFFGNCCIGLITNDKLPMLEGLFSSFFPNPEESARFKRDLTRKEYFHRRCTVLMYEHEFSSLERLFNVCLPNIQESVKFKQDFAKKDFFADYCAKLITRGSCPILEQMLRVFLPQTEDLLRFKHEIISKEFFPQYCETLMYGEQFAKIDDLLTLFLSNAEEILKFKQDFFLNSKKIRSQCLDYYGNGHFKRINNMLERFISHQDLILDYKKNLILSPEGLNRSIELFKNRSDVLTKITADSFIPDDLATEIKRTVIFSYSVIPTLQSWIKDGRVSILKDRINQFLITDVDKTVLKRQVFGNPLEFIRDFFFKNEVPAWQLLMLWRLESEAALVEYKRTMPIDEIFDDILNKCVFETYIPSGLRYCKFKSVVEFVALDRFLNWYFEMPRQRKEYKLKRIDSYMCINTIRMLLKKTDWTYLKIVMSWFFDKDNAEISKFKMMNRGRKILKYIDEV